MARSDVYSSEEIAAMRAEMAALQTERAQERAEVAMLRAQVDRYENVAKETEAQKRAFADFLAWVALTAEEKTQKVADRLFADAVLGEWWQVSLKDHPTVRVRAHSDFEATGRYNQVCGITETAHKHTAAPVGATAGVP